MAPQFVRKKLNNIEYLEVPGRENGKTIVLFHGYGADAFDLFPISQIDKSARWIFPFGIEELEIAPGYFGKAWFPISIALLQKALQAKMPHEIIKAFPQDLNSIRQNISQFLKELNIPPSDLILGGFSQGAVLATELALHEEENIKGLIILSGTLVNESSWKDLAHKHASLCFFQSHGIYDPILPIEGAHDLEKILKQGAMKGQLLTFHGGHEIPQGILLQLRSFLEIL